MVDYTSAYVKKIKNKKGQMVLSGIFNGSDIKENQHVSIVDYNDLQNIIKSEGFEDSENLIRKNQELNEELEYQKNKVKEYKRKLD